MSTAFLEAPLVGPSLLSVELKFGHKKSLGSVRACQLHPIIEVAADRLQLQRKERAAHRSIATHSAASGRLIPFPSNSHAYSVAIG